MIVKPVRMEYGWDRHNRSWCIMVFDENDNEIDNSYVGDKVSRYYEIHRFKEEYNIDNANIKKIKAY